MTARLPIDPFVLAIVATVVFAMLVPCPEPALAALGIAAQVSIALLFFLYGARLAPAAVWRGLMKWRLQALVVIGTFVLFPLLGLAAGVLVPDVLAPELYMGVLLLCLLPSTVQSSIAFTALAGGNVAAAVSATSASSVIGVVATPALAALLLGAQSELSVSGLEAVVLQLQLPFLAGQVARRWIAPWLERHRALTGLVDRTSVLLIVYMAVSAGTGHGAWQQLRVLDLVGVALVDFVLLVAALAALAAISRWCGLARPDEIVVVFCGGNKGLVTGVSILSALLPPGLAGIAVIPLILFHQMQLIVTATLASWYARRAPPTASLYPAQPPP